MTHPEWGVFSASTGSAVSIARELGIKLPVALSSRTLKTGGARGFNFGVVLVDETCWPLTPELKELLRPNLKHHGGYVIKLERHDILRGA